MMRSRTELITQTAAFTAAGLVLSYLETFIVLPVSVPGIRIGLANVSTILALYLCGPLSALTVTLIRVSLASVLFQTPVSFMYSIAGGLVSLAGMIVCRRTGFSVYGVSVSGAVLHNISQVCVAAVLIGNSYIFSIIPVLAGAGVGAGLLTGLCASVLKKRLEYIFNRSHYKEMDRDNDRISEGNGRRDI